MDRSDIEYLASHLADALRDVIGEQPSLRDRLAMSALNGLLASDAGALSSARKGYWFERPAEATAKAYELADAMLAARKPKEGT